MISKADSAKIRILEILAMTGEMTGENIKAFFSSGEYVRKTITALKNESLIRKSSEKGKPVYRLTSKGRIKLKEVLPDVFEPLLEGRKTMNKTRDDDRRIERRNKLIEVLLILHRADVKIFPDEKVLLSNSSLIHRTDNTDTTDFEKNTQPEFYTAIEIKSLIPDYKTANGSRALGVLFSHGKIYIIYTTDIGDLIWRKETEKNFRETTRLTLARRVYGTDNGTYLLVLGEKEKAAHSIINRYKSRTIGKIHPSDDLPHMIFALKDSDKDATLRIITQNDNFIERLEAKLNHGLIEDPMFPYFAGKPKGTEGEYDAHVFLFDLCAVAAALDVCKNKGMKVNLFCFDYQKPYFESMIKDEIVKERLTVISYTEEEGRESAYE